MVIIIIYSTVNTAGTKFDDTEISQHNPDIFLGDFRRMWCEAWTV